MEVVQNQIFQAELVHADFFEQLQAQPLETVRLGHAYFLRCTNENMAQAAWRLRLRPTLRRACRLEPALFKTIEGFWNVAMNGEEDTAKGEDEDGKSVASNEG